MWDTIKDYMNSLLGAIALLLSLIFIPEIKKYKFLIIIFSALLAILGIDKLYRDNNEKNINNKRNAQNEKRSKEDSATIRALYSNIKDLSDGRKHDSEIFKKFTDTLEVKFHIMRNPINNQPVKYNTYINRAEKVQIGPN